MVPPVGFRIVAGVRVFHRDLVGSLSTTGHPELERDATGATGSVEPRAIAGVDVEVAAASTLVGVGNRTAARQTPAAGQRNRAVDAARSRRGGQHQAALFRIECVWQLQQHAVRVACARQGQQRLELAAGNVRHRTIDFAETATG
jgi:hypothetical protein